MVQKAQLNDFKNDVVKFNSWFADMELRIVKEEGKGKYNEYLRSLFRTYLKCDNNEFVEAIKDEKRQSTQGKLPADYFYRELLELGRVTYNNINEDLNWTSNPKEAKPGSGDNKKDATDSKKFLALATKMVLLKLSDSDLKVSEKSTNNSGKRTFLPWRFENKEGATTKVVRGTVMKWCKNNCHRQDCLNKADFAKKMKEMRNEGSSSANDDTKSSKQNVLNNFKIALAVICSNDDYKSLKEQFFQGN